MQSNNHFPPKRAFSNGFLIIIIHSFINKINTVIHNEFAVCDHENEKCPIYVLCFVFVCFIHAGATQYGKLAWHSPDAMNG